MSAEVDKNQLAAVLQVLKKYNLKVILLLSYKDFVKLILFRERKNY